VVYPEDVAERTGFIAFSDVTWTGKQRNRAGGATPPGPVESRGLGGGALAQHKLACMWPVYFVGHPPGPYPDRSPLPPRVFLSKFPVFNGLATVISCKHFVLSDLKSKYLKTRCLFGCCAIREPGGRTLVCARRMTLNYRLADSSQMICKMVFGGRG
jgi:hypothetical protein